MIDENTTMKELAEMLRARGVKMIHVEHFCSRRANGTEKCMGLVDEINAFLAVHTVLP